MRKEPIGSRNAKQLSARKNRVVSSRSIMQFVYCCGVQSIYDLDMGQTQFEILFFCILACVVCRSPNFKFFSTMKLSIPIWICAVTGAFLVGFSYVHTDGISQVDEIRLPERKYYTDTVWADHFKFKCDETAAVDCCTMRDCSPHFATATSKFCHDDYSELDDGVPGPMEPICPPKVGATADTQFTIIPEISIKFIESSGMYGETQKRLQYDVKKPDDAKKAAEAFSELKKNEDMNDDWKDLCHNGHPGPKNDYKGKDDASYLREEGLLLPLMQVTEAEATAAKAAMKKTGLCADTWVIGEYKDAVANGREWAFLVCLIPGKTDESAKRLSRIMGYGEDHYKADSTPTMKKIFKAFVETNYADGDDGATTNQNLAENSWLACILEVDDGSDGVCDPNLPGVSCGECDAQSTSKAVYGASGHFNLASNSYSLGNDHNQDGIYEGGKKTSPNTDSDANFAGVEKFPGDDPSHYKSLHLIGMKVLPLGDMCLIAANAAAKKTLQSNNVKYFHGALDNDGATGSAVTRASSGAEYYQTDLPNRIFSVDPHEGAIFKAAMLMQWDHGGRVLKSDIEDSMDVYHAYGASDIRVGSCRDYENEQIPLLDFVNGYSHHSATKANSHDMADKSFSFHGGSTGLGRAVSIPDHPLIKGVRFNKHIGLVMNTPHNSQYHQKQCKRSCRIGRFSMVPLIIVLMLTVGSLTVLGIIARKEQDELVRGVFIVVFVCILGWLAMSWLVFGTVVGDHVANRHCTFTHMHDMVVDNYGEAASASLSWADVIDQEVKDPRERLGTSAFLMMGSAVCATIAFGLAAMDLCTAYKDNDYSSVATHFRF